MFTKSLPTTIKSIWTRAARVKSIYISTYTKRDLKKLKQLEFEQYF